MSDAIKNYEKLGALNEDLEALNRELEDELDQLEDRLDPQTEELETVSIPPRRSDIEVRRVALAWDPNGDRNGFR